MSTSEDMAHGELAAKAQRLLETWDRLASSHMMVGAGCSCGAGGLVIALGDFEQDIVDYLQAEAERYQRTDVLALLEDYARKKEQWSVSRLLTSLAQPAAAPQAAAGHFILERLSRTLLSFEKLHSGR